MIDGIYLTPEMQIQTIEALKASQQAVSEFIELINSTNDVPLMLKGLTISKNLAARLNEHSPS